MGQSLIRISLCTLLLACSYESIAAYNPNQYAENTNALSSDYKKRLQDQSRLLNRLNQEMADLEFYLGKESKKFSKVQDDKRFVEDKIFEARKNLDLDSENLKKQSKEAKSLLMGLVFQKLENKEEAVDLLKKKLFVEMLQKRVLELDSLIKRNQALQTDLTQLEERYSQFASNEKEILSFINEYQNKKKEIEQKIADETIRKNELSQKSILLKKEMTIPEVSKKPIARIETNDQGDVEEINVKDALNRPATNVQNVQSSEFGIPLKKFASFEHGQKGITFKFDQAQIDVISPKSGKIVYTGALSTFGNVVMIDHGQDVRTVLLGQFDFTVKNGQSVNAGEVVGKTRTGSSENKLYFEIRKSNVAQNTIQLVDKQNLQKTYYR